VIVAPQGSLALALLALLGCSASGEASPEPRPVEAPAKADSEAPDLRIRYSGALTQGGYICGVMPTGTIAARLGEQELALAADGSFFAAFDRDSPASLDLTARLADGRSITRTIAVAPREWQISRVDVPLRARGTSEEWWRKRKPEWEAIVAARAMETGASGWRDEFIWPVKGRISGLFGRQRIYRGEPGSYHSGIDIAPGNGVPFVAPADGVVVLARTGFSLEGGLIIIDHGGGLNSAFLHASRIAVTEGERVTQGQQIGNVGATGRATGPHLHWSLKWRDARLDPLLFTGPMD
jgi:murein DD-endopeptidase MepM/ murein hydrolase activator NlpD